MSHDMDNVKRMVKRVDRRELNNTQRVLVSLLTANGWVARTSLRVPNVSARLRDLRKDEFGGFEVECATPEQLGRENRSEVTRKQTYYRLNPSSVNMERVRACLGK